jgi:hypothetical protein
MGKGKKESWQKLKKLRNESVITFDSIMSATTMYDTLILFTLIK